MVSKKLLGNGLLAIYVDDIVITSNDPLEILNIKAHLHATFSIKDLGNLNYFLGLEVHHIQNGIILHQNKFTKELLNDSGITNYRKVVTPLPSKLKLSAHEGDLLQDPTSYRILHPIGSSLVNSIF